MKKLIRGFLILLVVIVFFSSCEAVMTGSSKETAKETTEKTTDTTKDESVYGSELVYVETLSVSNGKQIIKFIFTAESSNYNYAGCNIMVQYKYFAEDEECRANYTIDGKTKEAFTEIEVQGNTVNISEHNAACFFVYETGEIDTYAQIDFHIAPYIIANGNKPIYGDLHWITFKEGVRVNNSKTQDNISILLVPQML